MPHTKGKGDIGSPKAVAEATAGALAFQATVTRRAAPTWARSTPTR